MFKGINKALGDLAPFVAMAIGILAAPWATQNGWHAAVVGFTTGGIASGSLKGALLGAFSGAVFHKIGAHFEKLSGINT